jgi:hypothetical protein
MAPFFCANEKRGLSFFAHTHKKRSSISGQLLITSSPRELRGIFFGHKRFEFAAASWA